MNKSLFRLLQLCDLTLPIGGFAHSAGLETYVQAGIVKDKTTAKEFIIQMLSRNLRYTDGALVSLSYDAAENNDINRIIELDELCTAVKLPMELRQASNKLGVRLMKIFQPMYAESALPDSSLINQYLKTVKMQLAAGHFCIAFGILAQAMQIPKLEALTGYYYNAASGFMTNSVKLVPLSQQHGQEILFSLQELIDQLAEASLSPNEEDIGLCCTGFDIRSMQHEHLYSRLYMS